MLHEKGDGAVYCTEIFGTKLHLETADGIFSPNGPDAGTLAMLGEVEVRPDDRVLDLGCGCGIVGIYCAKKVGAENVVMCDISPTAAGIAQKNAEENGVGGIKVYCGDGPSALGGETFTLILSNPPYHTDFSVAKRFIEDGFKRLEVGGRMVMVTKRLDWYKNKLISVFGGVKIYRINEYFVFVAEKRSQVVKKEKKAKTGLSKKLQRKSNHAERGTE